MITFDTLKFANTLKAAGVPSAQAEAEAIALSEVLEVNLKDLVTKDDMHRDMRDLEQRLVIKLGALLAVAIGVVAALVKLLLDYKDASAATSYRHGLPVSSLHGRNVYKPSLASGFRPTLATLSLPERRTFLH